MYRELCIIAQLNTRLVFIMKFVPEPAWLGLVLKQLHQRFAGYRLLGLP